MTDSRNKQTVLEYVDAFNHANMETLRRLHTEDAVIRGVLGWGGLNEVMPIWQMLHDAFAVSMHVDSIIEEGDIVAVRYTERGTSVGPFRGQEPTGKSYEIVAMEWFEMKEGLIHRRWGARDSGAQQRQMGLAPL